MSSPQKKIIKVYDKDGQYKTMIVEQKTTSGEVCEKLGKKLFMKTGDMPLFNLYVFEGGVKQALKMTDFPFDVISRLERKEYKFYFLNVQGEFMSFQEQVANSMTAQATQKPSAVTNSATSPSYTSGGAQGQGSSPSSPLSSPPMASIKPSAGMSGYLMRKKAGKFFKTWVVAKNRNLTFHSSEESAAAGDQEPLMDLSLENAVIELKSSDQGPYILVTLANSERHTLMSENQGDLQAWATELAATSAYSTSQATKIASPTMAFIPTSKDLGIKLVQKMENIETQSATLIKWTEYLVGRRTGIQHGDDIGTCYSDGSILANVIDALFNKKIKYRRGKSVYEMQYNIDGVLDTLKSLGADFGKLIASDIVECKVNRVVVRLIWSIFVAFVANGEKEYVAKDRLIGWCGRRVQETNRSIIVDGPSALQNPLVFAALLNISNAGQLINMDELARRSRVEQSQEVLDKAHDHFGIPKLFSASQWQQDGDDKSFLIYLSFFYYKLSGEARDKAELIETCREAKNALEPETIVSSRERQLKSMRVEQQNNPAVAAAPAASINKPLAVATSAPTNTIVKPSAIKQAAKMAPKPQANTQPKQEVKVQAPVQTPVQVMVQAPPVVVQAPVQVEVVEPPQPQVVVEDLAALEKAAKRKEAEERAEALAKQMELEMLQFENEDSEIEERMRQQEELDEQMRQQQIQQQQQEQEYQHQMQLQQQQMLQQQQQQDYQQQQALEEMERLQREEFEREQEALSLQSQIEEQDAESQRLLEQWENQRRLEDQAEQQRRHEQEMERQQELHHLSTQSSIGDELDKILRAEQAQQEIENEQQHHQTHRVDSVDEPTVNQATNSLMDMFDQIQNDLASINMSPAIEEDHHKPAASNSRSASPTPVDSSRSSISHDDGHMEDNYSEPDMSPRPSEAPSQQEQHQQQQQQSQQQQQQQDSDEETQSQSQSQSASPSLSQSQQQQQPPEQENRGRVVVRICLEGFGDVLFCSFAVGYDTLCGTVRQMVVKKMKVRPDVEQNYLLFIVRDGLERVLEDEEVLLEAEDRVDRFVFKLSEEHR
ncbi:hypothetical protein SAMD00019534_055050 [Acytostelium subglobosum LB1]|uniref:hypothetical protein n=1 Tax=Acytostelium subglobosum LB1 TaxID=1410327 RepID=UPI000644C392|nr:hypothetical protein SAMD00019534_055050 [Acytostelium subglobosum LB1]GAM22330.1 hypothetical protein SAMD00019534_055050 [Acytostelium subglobosum LB1]|eukprot:XP_012754450.1 hypothetical protein SAMD00019534_055050 [Acytostelium subglobosum LB1]